MSSVPPPMVASTEPSVDSPAAALRTVLQITELVSQSKSVAELAERALDAIVVYTRFPCCGLFQLDPTGTRLTMVAHRNVSAAVQASARELPVQGSLTGVAIQRGCIVTASDIVNDERIEPNTRNALAKEGYVEVASIPLIFRQRALGTINLIYQKGDKLSAAERDTLLGIGQTVAIALAQRSAEDEQQRLHEQIRKTEQLERLGVLAGGLAHDFNNNLTSILGSISLGQSLLLNGGETAEVVRLLETARNATNQAASLVHQLLTFSKGGVPVLQSTTQLGALIRESAEFSVHGSSVRLVFDIAPDLLGVDIDPAQISRVVQNLVLNAVQASRKGGTVRIAVNNDFTLTPARSCPQVVISVSDRGVGISAHALPRIFDPYFTTKHGGNGLGLAIVQSIVHAHGGTVQVLSEPDEGTTILVALPGKIDVASDSKTVAGPLPAIPRGGRALVMDDDASIRTLAKRILEREGFEVVTAADGLAAIEAAEQSTREQKPLMLVLLDLTVVGGMGGRDAMPRIRQLVPNVVAIVCSGYSEDAAMSRYEHYGFDAVLAKPYAIERLLHTIRSALGARAQAPGS